MTRDKCETCGKKLRSDNQSGICSGCRKAGGTGTHDEGGGSSTPSPERDVLRRFRKVAARFGKDADAMLASFAQRWLDDVTRSVESASSAPARPLASGMVLAPKVGTGP